MSLMPLQRAYSLPLSTPKFGADKDDQDISKGKVKKQQDIGPRYSADGKKIVISVKDLNLWYPRGVPGNQAMADNLKKLAHTMIKWIPGVTWQPKYAPNATHILDNVSFDIHEGETIGVAGESGCGKSTVGNAILGLATSATKITGQVWIDGAGNFYELTPNQRQKLRRDIQIIMQSPSASMSPRMSVGEIISEGLDVHFRRERKIPKVLHWLPIPKTRKMTFNERSVEAGRLLEMVGLNASDAIKYPHEFSGGQKQRICIARALAVNPKFIFADEIVSALDVTVQVQVLNLIKRLSRELNIAMLFVAHDLNVIRLISDREIVMYLGRPVEDKPAEAPYVHPYSKKLRELAPEITDPDNPRPQVPLMPGEVGSLVNPPTGCRFHPRCEAGAEFKNSTNPDNQAKWAKCRTEKPEAVEIGPKHKVACHHVLEILKRMEELDKKQPPPFKIPDPGPEAPSAPEKPAGQA